MELLTLEQISRAVNGKINNELFLNESVSAVSTDSRDKLAGALFIPIRGEKFDGHDYINEAFTKGAACVLSEKPIDSDKPVICVKNTKSALACLARYYRSRFKIPVVAVTGSAGKTTTKDLIHSVLSVKYKTLKNEGNFNNEIGLPLTVFRLDASYEAAVFEMGMSGFGEIRNLANIARPDVAVITNIGDAHIEKLGSREGIFKAKREIFEFLDEKGIIIVNGDDDLLKTLKNSNKNVRLFGLDRSFDCCASDIENNGLRGIGFTVNINSGDKAKRSFRVSANMPGEHTVYNALAAAAVGDALGLMDGQISEGIENSAPSAMRMDIRTSKRGVTIINDAYNANPASMRAAIDVLAAAEGVKTAILGDMLELGDMSAKLHYETGRYAALKNIDVILCAGEKAKYMYDGVIDAVKNNGSRSEARYFPDKQSLLSVIGKYAKSDAVLVKASRGMAFEDVVEKLEGLWINR